MAEDLGKLALTDAETELFDAVTSGIYSNFALMQGYFDGKRCAYIVALDDEAGDSGEVAVTPLFLLLDHNDDDLMARVGGTEGEPTRNKEEVEDNDHDSITYDRGVDRA